MSALKSIPVALPPSLPPESARCIRVSRSLRGRLDLLEELLRSDRPDAALEAVWQCRDLDRTREQTGYLARLAFNAAVARQGDPVAWWGQALELSREAGEYELADRCLLALAGHAAEEDDLDRAERCLDLVRGGGHRFASARLAVAFRRGRDDGRTLEARVEKVLETLPPDLGEVKKLLDLVKDSGVGLSVRVLEAAFDKLGETEKLYFTALKCCVPNRLMAETDELIQNFAAWFCGQERDNNGEFYDDVMLLCHDHVRYSAESGAAESVVSSCGALAFLCGHAGDERGRRVFLWHLLKALTAEERFEEAEKVLKAHKLSPGSKPEDAPFLPACLEVVLARQDFASLDGLLKALIKVPDGPATLMAFMDRLVARLDADAALVLVRHVAASAEAAQTATDGAETVALLTELTVNLLLDSDKDKEPNDANIREMIRLISDHLDGLSRFCDVDWLTRILWNSALRARANATRFWALSLMRRLLPEEESERLLACLLLQLAAAVAVTEEGRAPYDVREEIGRLTAQIDEVPSSSMPERQRRLVAVYKTRLTLLTEDRFAGLARSVTAMLGKGEALDGRTLAVVSKLLEEATESRRACASYGKLVCRIYREAIKRSLHEGECQSYVMELFCKLIVYSTTHCSSFQGASDMDDLIGYLARLSPDSLPQESVARLMSQLWNRGLALSLSGSPPKMEKAEELQGMAKALAPFARRYRMYFQAGFSADAFS